MEPLDREAVKYMRWAVKERLGEDVQRLVQGDRRLLQALDGNQLFIMLFIAAERGQLPLVLYLLDEGVDIDQRSIDGRTALYYASRVGNHGVVTALLERGADPLIADLNGSTPLIIATHFGHVRVVEALLAHGCGDVNHRTFAGGMSALHVACWEGNVNVVRLLLEAGGDLTSVDEDGRTPLDLAVLQESARVVQLLDVRLFVKWFRDDATHPEAGNADACHRSGPAPLSSSSRPGASATTPSPESSLGRWQQSRIGHDWRLRRRTWWHGRRGGRRCLRWR